MLILFFSAAVSPDGLSFRASSPVTASLIDCGLPFTTERAAVSIEFATAEVTDNEPEFRILAAPLIAAVDALSTSVTAIARPPPEPSLSKPSAITFTSTSLTESIFTAPEVALIVVEPPTTADDVLSILATAIVNVAVSDAAFAVAETFVFDDARTVTSVAASMTEAPATFTCACASDRAIAAEIGRPLKPPISRSTLVSASITTASLTDLIVAPVTSTVADVVFHSIRPLSIDAGFCFAAAEICTTPAA